jgi:hypothetical protein
MMMFDQVGSACQLAGGPPEQGPSFVKALKSFAAGVGELEREALYALRCSLVHDFSLVNIGSSRRTHHFMLDDGEQLGPVVRLPPEPWDGQLGHCRMSNATWVNLRSLGDSAEEVFTRLVDLHEQNELAIALPGGVAELQRRYAMTIRPGLRVAEP